MKGVINPQRSRVMPYWDATIFAALIFTALLTPFEVSLLMDSIPTSWVNDVAKELRSIGARRRRLRSSSRTRSRPKKGGRWASRGSRSS